MSSITADGRSSGKPHNRKVSSGSTHKLKFLTPEEREFYAPIGLKLREARVASGVKQTEMAACLGVSLSHISDIENAYSKISIQEMYRYCHIAKTDSNRILSEIEKKEESEAGSAVDAQIMKNLEAYSEQQKIQLLTFMKYLNEQEVKKEP